MLNPEEAEQILNLKTCYSCIKRSTCPADKDNKNCEDWQPTTYRRAVEQYLKPKLNDQIQQLQKRLAESRRKQHAAERLLLIKQAEYFELHAKLTRTQLEVADLRQDMNDYRAECQAGLHDDEVDEKDE
jgi:hypothetical protein